MPELAPVGWAPVYVDRRGQHHVDIRRRRSAAVDYDDNLDDDVGYDDDVGDDDDVDGDDDVGAVRPRKRQRLQRRRNRQEERLDNRWGKKGQRLGTTFSDVDDDDDVPRVNRMKRNSMSAGNTTTITAAGAWSITITPSTSGILENFMASGPANTYVSQIQIGNMVVNNGQNLDVSFFGPTGSKPAIYGQWPVTAGVPIVVSGSTLSTSGVVSAAFFGTANPGPC